MTIQYEIRAQAGTPVQRAFRGKDHTVVPLIALVEGVLQAANAPSPEFVGTEAMAKTVAGWNGRPVVIDHPRVNGEFVSANLPEVLETELVGHVFNARVEDGKLKMEAWIANETHGGAERIERTLEKVKEGEVVELSTGFYADALNSPGEFEGKSFDRILTNIVPDHLAILSEGKGACSVEDGAGTNRVNRSAEVSAPPGKPESREKKGMLERMFEALRLRSNRTHADIEFALQAKLGEVLQEDFFFIWDVTADTVVYYVSEGLVQRSFKFADDGSVMLGEDVMHVRPETNFVPLIEHEETNMPKPETTTQVDQLIANSATQFTEDDRAWLSDLDEDRLARLTPNEVPAEVVEVPAEVGTFDELLAKAPKALQESVAHGQRLYEAQRVELVQTIKANEKNKFSEAQLESFDFEMLESLAALAAQEDFSGRGGPRVHTVEDTDAIPAPPQVFETA